jgi:hypothetical protein
VRGGAPDCAESCRSARACVPRRVGYADCSPRSPLRCAAQGHALARNPDNA